jgi:hypothetical protein
VSETAYQGYEVEQPAGFMEPKVYRVRWECPACGHKWSKTFKSIPSDDPDCPSVKCAVARETSTLALQVANLTRMLQEQRAPATIGDKLVVKAIDATAQIVMEDNQLTDLKDNIRRGESMAPKLPPAAQTAADNFFKKGAQAGAQAGARVLGTNKTLNVRQTNHMKTLGQRAIHGAFRNASVPPNVVLPKTRPVGQMTQNPGFVRR